MTKRCLWCREEFEIKRKRVALCPECRIERKREYDRQYQEERERDRQVLLNRILDKVPAELHSRAYELVDEYLDLREKGFEQFAPVQPMPGQKTAYGPDEGRSSFFADLRIDLDRLCQEAATHPWWDEHPPEDVFFGLHEIEDFPGYLAELEAKRREAQRACGDAKGEHKGYMRHVRAGESACEECLQAKAAYVREQYLKSVTR